jgi:glycerol-3-phosphate acyltransferase PlsY
MLTLKLVTALALGYLFGSIPFGLLFTRLAGTRDLREIGSGNIGATNVLRTGRKGLAAATLLCDTLKGTFAVIIGGYIAGPNGAIVAALGAFLGHLFPIWLRFRGGKGVATYIGLLLGLFWPAALIFCGVWLIVALVTRYSSASALIASVTTPFVLWYFGHPALALLFAAMTVLLWFMHRSNIAKLFAGTESKIGAKGDDRPQKPASNPDSNPDLGHNGGPPLGDNPKA